MALKLPKGTQFGFAPVVATKIATTGISKAAPALASIAADAVDTDDVVVLEIPGWPALNNRTTRAGAESAGAIELLGTDTTDTTLYPGTSGAGFLRKAGAFIDLDQQGDPTDRRRRAAVLERHPAGGPDGPPDPDPDLQERQDHHHPALLRSLQALVSGAEDGRRQG